MATKKLNLFTPQEQELAQFAKALSHPARIAILKVLAANNDCVCGEIVQVLPLAQSTVSQHLKELKDAGLIKGEIDGAKSCYCINWQNVEKVVEDLSFLFGQMKNESKKTCC